MTDSGRFHSAGVFGTTGSILNLVIGLVAEVVEQSKDGAEIFDGCRNATTGTTKVVGVKSISPVIEGVDRGGTSD